MMHLQYTTILSLLFKVAGAILATFDCAGNYLFPKHVNTIMQTLRYMEKQCKGIAQVMGRGKITIPKEIRDVMNINDGDYVGFIVWKIDVSEPGKE